jgi:dTDP-4-amino-4,6-dideoxygalactose transaminase
MNDISAALGLAALEEFQDVLDLRISLFKKYEQLLNGLTHVKFVGGGYTDRVHAAWMSTVVVENRTSLMKKLRENGVESAQVHYRNDRYSIFGGRKDEFPNMDAIEDKYLVLPLHTKMQISDVERICQVLISGW